MPSAWEAAPLALFVAAQLFLLATAKCWSTWESSPARALPDHVANNGGFEDWCTLLDKNDAVDCLAEHFHLARSLLAEECTLQIDVQLRRGASAIVDAMQNGTAVHHDTTGGARASTPANVANAYIVDASPNEPALLSIGHIADGVGVSVGGAESAPPSVVQFEVTRSEFNELCRERLGVKPAGSVRRLIKYGGPRVLALLFFAAALVAAAPALYSAARSACVAVGGGAWCPGVDCGGHTSATGTCHGCPEGNLNLWCNGECRWDRKRGLCLEAAPDLGAIHAAALARLEWLFGGVLSAAQSTRVALQATMQDARQLQKLFDNGMTWTELLSIPASRFKVAAAVAALPIAAFAASAAAVLEYAQPAGHTIRTINLASRAGKLWLSNAAGPLGQAAGAVARVAGYARGLARVSMCRILSGPYLVNAMDSDALLALWSCALAVAAALAAAAIIAVVRRLLVATERETASGCARPAKVDEEKALLEAGRSVYCVVCLDARKTTALFPCKHMHTCAGCAKECEACPICRTRIFRRQTFFV